MTGKGSDTVIGGVSGGDKCLHPTRDGFGTRFHHQHVIGAVGRQANDGVGTVVHGVGVRTIATGDGVIPGAAGDAVSQSTAGNDVSVGGTGHGKASRAGAVIQQSAGSRQLDGEGVISVCRRQNHCGEVHYGGTQMGADIGSYRVITFTHQLDRAGAGDVAGKRFSLLHRQGQRAARRYGDRRQAQCQVDFREVHVAVDDQNRLCELQVGTRIQDGRVRQGDGGILEAPGAAGLELRCHDLAVDVTFAESGGGIGRVQTHTHQSEGGTRAIVVAVDVRQDAQVDVVYAAQLLQVDAAQLLAVNTGVEVTLAIVVQLKATVTIFDVTEPYGAVIDEVGTIFTLGHGERLAVLTEGQRRAAAGEYQVGARGQAGDVDINGVDIAVSGINRLGGDVILTRGGQSHRRASGIGRVDNGAQLELVAGQNVHRVIGGRVVAGEVKTRVEDHVQQLEPTGSADRDVTHHVGASGANIARFVIAIRRQQIAGVISQDRVDGQRGEVDQGLVDGRVDDIVDLDIANRSLTAHVQGQVFNVLETLLVAEGQATGQVGKGRQLNRAVEGIRLGQGRRQIVQVSKVNPNDGARQAGEQLLHILAVDQVFQEPQAGDVRAVVIGVDGAGDTVEQPDDVDRSLTLHATAYSDGTRRLLFRGEPDGLAEQRISGVGVSIISHIGQTNRDITQVGCGRQRDIVIRQGRRGRHLDTAEVVVDQLSGVVVAAVGVEIGVVTQVVDHNLAVVGAIIRASDDVQPTGLRRRQGQGHAVGQHDGLTALQRQIQAGPVRVLIDVQGGVGTQINVQRALREGRRSFPTRAVTDVELTASGCAAEVEGPAGFRRVGVHVGVQVVCNQRHAGNTGARGEDEVGAADVLDDTQVQVTAQAGGVDAFQIVTFNAVVAATGIGIQHDVTRTAEGQRGSVIELERIGTAGYRQGTRSLVVNHQTGNAGVGGVE